jgi:AcrR family transcriptional regulator
LSAPAHGRRPGLETKDRILDVAERLFDERGIAGTSLRAVTAEAGVNVAAVHYHFGSKEDLTRAVVLRRAGPVNAERLRRLDAIEAEAGAEGPRVESILEAFFRAPVQLWTEGGATGASFLFHEPAERIQPLVEEVMGEMASRFLAALVRALPHLEPGEVAERFQLVIGVLIHVLSGRMRWEPQPIPARSVDGRIRVLVDTLAAAMRAPAIEENS